MDAAAVKAWKQAYGQVYSVNIRGVDYVFRALSFAEFDRLRLDSPESAVDAEDQVVDLALLHPAEGPPPTAAAGIISSLAEQIINVSGFGSPGRMKEVLGEKRQLAEGDVRTTMKAYVIATMPSYRDEELDLLTFDQLAAKVALAEQILKLQRAAIDHEVTVDIIDPEEEAARAQQEKAKHAATRQPGQPVYDDPIAARLRAAMG